MFVWVLAEPRKENDVGYVWDWNVWNLYVESAKREYAFNRKQDLAKELYGD